MAQRPSNPIVTDALFVVAGIVATLVAQRAVNIVWVAATGKEAPKDPGDPRVGTGEAVAFAVTTGACVGVLRLLVQRKANQVKAKRAARAA
jgi:hypothetical protein